jgi:MerR family transcriptional regulator, copper efflux regulator
MKMITIGQLSKSTGLTVVTIRYYEKEGLLEGIQRSKGGFRLYPENLVPRFHFIKNAKAVGFALAEIKALIELQNGPTPSSSVKQKTRNKIESINQKIATLTHVKQALSQWEQACDGKVSADKCPILMNLYKPPI